MVGFFLAGLVTHGGLQGWWIAPVLGSLGDLPLMLTATILTAFNYNVIPTVQNLNIYSEDSQVSLT